MTERKPAGMTFESWIDKQIREAQERGDFEDLPGKGKPIPGIDEPADADWWVKAYLKREKLVYLPPTLALRKEVEDALDGLSSAPSEAAVRGVVDALNEKIRHAIRYGLAGPPLNLMPLDVEKIVADWLAR